MEARPLSGDAMVIEGGTLVEPFEPPVEDGAVLIEGGTVTYSGPRRRLPGRAAQLPRLDAGGGYIVPGLVDVHVHGGGGVDTMDASPDGLRAMSRAHARAGTTSLLCTTVTAALEPLLEAERAVVEAARRQRAWWRGQAPARTTAAGAPASRASTWRGRTSTPSAKAPKTPTTCGIPTSGSCRRCWRPPGSTARSCCG
ncbi:amidohydrolase family protein [Geochorda subterranea]|uniref:amidohydrolase family protein n=1 Tax=Geochorda subterranea TaxID=3109564 RepID=UPI0038601A23